MNESAACKKITSLLAMYIDKKLDLDTMEFVKAHLEVCSTCYKKYILLKGLINELRKAYQEITTEAELQEKNQKFNIKEYENFQSNLSSYFDNELSLNQCISMKKYMIKFPNARKDLEQLYNLHKLVINSQEAVKKTLTQDYSHTICHKLFGKSKKYKQKKFLKIASFAGILIIISSIIGTNISFTKTVLEKSKDFFKRPIYVHNKTNNNFIPIN